MFGTDEVTKAQRAVTTLRSKLDDLERRRSEAGQRRVELTGERQVLLLRISEGDDSAARRELRGLDGRTQNLVEDEQAFGAAIADVETKLAQAKKNAARAEREQAIDALERQIAQLPTLDSELEAAMGQVRAKADVLIAAVSGIGKILEELDAKRFDSQWLYRITSRIREVCWNRFEEMAVPSATPRPPFLERARLDFVRAVAQARYMSRERIVAGRNEKLYRATAHTCLRDVALLPGQLIALTDAEAVQPVRDGSAELVQQPEPEHTDESVLA